MKTKLILFLFLTINLGVPLGFIPFNEASAQEFTNSTGTYFDFNNGTVNHLTFANGTAVPQIVIPDPATPPDFAQLSETPFTISYDLVQFPDQALNIIDNGNTITIENKGVSSVYNKDTCSLSLFNPNEIETEFAKESWSVHSATWGSDNWNGLPVNSESCETGFTNTQHTATINAVRQNDDGIFRVQYSFDLYSIKTTVYYTNYNENTFGGINNDGSVWYGNPTKFGFVNSFSNMQTDVPDLQDGFTQSGTDFVINEQYDIEYKFLDSTRLLWGINNNVDNIYIDFKKVSKPTQYGQSQVIDPHLTAHPNEPQNVDSDQTEVLKIDLDWDAGSTSGSSFASEWTDNETNPSYSDTSVDEANENYEIDSTNESTSDYGGNSLSYDLGSAVDSDEWVMQFTTKVVTEPSLHGNAVLWFGLSDGVFEGCYQVDCTDENGDILGIQLHLADDYADYLYADGHDQQRGWSGLSGFNHADGSTHYWQVKRTSQTDMTVEYHGTSGFGSVSDTNSYSSVPTGIENLDHVFIGMPDENYMGTWTYDVDNIKVWDGTTSTSGTPIFDSDAVAFTLDDPTGYRVYEVELNTPSDKSTTLTNTSDFSLFTTDETNDSVTRNNSGSYDSSWAYQSSSITASADYEYYVNDVLVWTSTDFNSGTLYPSIASDMNSVGVDWQLSEYNDNEVEWTLVGYSNNGNNQAWSTFVGVHNSQTKSAWGQMQASFFIGSGTPNTLQVVERSGGATNYVYTDLTHTMTVGDTFKIVVNPSEITTVLVSDTGDTDTEYQVTQTWGTEDVDVPIPYDLSDGANVADVHNYDSVDSRGMDIFWKPDGTMLWLMGYANDKVFEYTLTTAWDITTMSKTAESGSLTSYDTSPTGLHFSPDGEKFFMVGRNQNNFDYFTLSAWDITTLSHQTEWGLGGYSSMNLWDNEWSENGHDYVWLLSDEGTEPQIYQWEILAHYGAWDFNGSDDRYEWVIDDEVSGGEPNAYGMAWNDDGSQLVVSGENGIHIFDTTTAFRLQTASYDSTYDVCATINAYHTSANCTQAGHGIAWGNDGKTLYMTTNDDYQDGDMYLYALDMDATTTEQQDALVSLTSANIGETFTHKVSALNVIPATSVTLDEDFADSTGWTIINTDGSTTSGACNSGNTSQAWSVSDNKLWWNAKANTANSGSGAYYDLTSVDDDEWVLQFNMETCGRHDNESGGNMIGVGLFSDEDMSGSAGNTGGTYDSGQDYARALLYNENGMAYRGIVSDGCTDLWGCDGSSNSNTVVTSNVDGTKFWYIQLTKSSTSSYTMTVGTDDFGGTVDGGSHTSTGTIDTDDVRYLKLETVALGDNANRQHGYISNLKFYDGVSEVTTGSEYESDLSSSTSWTLTDDLPAPTNLTAQSGIPIQLDWDDVANAVTYQVYRDSGSGFTLLANAGSDSDYDDSSTVAGTSYDYKVSALGPNPANLLESALSSQVTATAGQPPDAITSVTASISNAQTDPHVVTLTWGEPSDWQTGTPQSYEVFESVGSSGNMQSVSSALTYVAGTFTHTHNISGIQPLTDYYYLVRATSTHGTSADSNIPSVTTVDVPVKPDTPVATQPDTTATPYLVSLSWSDNGDGGSDIKGHQIDRWDSNSNAWTTIETDTGSVATTYQDTSIVSPAIDVKYRIGVINGVGVSTLSDESNTVTIPDTPLVPNNVSCTTDSSTQITVTWQVPSSDGGSALTYYNVYQPHPSNQVQYATNVYTHVATGLTQGTLYQFDVSAQNNVGDGSYASCTATTSIAPAGTFQITQDWIVYDTMEVSYLAVVSAGNPSPTVEDIKIKLDGTTVATVPVGSQVSIGQQLTGTLQIKLPDLVQHDLTADMRMTNTGNEVTVTSNTLSVIATFLPTYKEVVEGQGLVAWDLTRDETQTELNIEIFKDTAPFNVNCALLTPEQASKTVDKKITSMDSHGVGSTLWQNATSVGYHNATSTVNGNLSYYVFCYEQSNPYLLMFSDVSYSTLGSALASGLSGLEADLGLMLGGPLISIFVVMLAGQATGRTAPTFIILVLVAVGILMGLGFFVIDEAIWGLILIMGSLGVLVGKKFL